MTITPQEALTRCIDHREIFHDEMLALMRMIMRGELSPAITAALLMGLRVKKETIGEISAAAQVMREFANHVEVDGGPNFVDIVGTGGDGSHTFNISTASMFVVAAAGAKVAKHGNRGVSSKSGSADVLEALGAQINLQAQQVARCIDEIGLGFMFAPNHHPAMKNVAAARKLLQSRTAFNLLGPLCNPACVKHQLIGVFSEDYLERIVNILQRRGAQNVMTVHSQDGLDELSTTSKNKICFLREGNIGQMIIDPQKFRLHPATVKDFQITTKQEAIKAFVSVLNGTASQARIEVVALNSAAGLVVGNVAKDLEEGLQLSLESIKSGDAFSHFENFVKDCGDYAKLKEITQ